MSVLSTLSQSHTEENVSWLSHHSPENYYIIVHVFCLYIFSHVGACSSQAAQDKQMLNTTLLSLIIHLTYYILMSQASKMSQR